MGDRKRPFIHCRNGMPRNPSAQRSASPQRAAARPAPVGVRLRVQALHALNRRLDRLALTQQQTAQLLGLAQPQVSRLRRGLTAGFSLERLLDLAARTGLGVRLTLARPYRKPQ